MLGSSAVKPKYVESTTTTDSYVCMFIAICLSIHPYLSIYLFLYLSKYLSSIFQFLNFRWYMINLVKDICLSTCLCLTIYLSFLISIFNFSFKMIQRKSNTCIKCIYLNLKRYKILNQIPVNYEYLIGHLVLPKYNQN